jgi:small subunit ribosomal protein S2
VATTTEETPQAVGVRDLLEAGLHFGHQTKRWNPKMKRYIFDKRNRIHIIDLAKSLVMLQDALRFVYDVVVAGKSILFVGTKKQAQQVIKETALDCGQHYVTQRWLGGTLTNNTTIRRGVSRLREIEALEKSDAFSSMHKKEAARLRRELEKLRRNLCGIADMESLPGALFVVDINREAIAVAEANTLNIPVLAIVDTNCDPDPVDYVIPGNDDAIRAIRLIACAVADSVRTASKECARLAAEQARRQAAEQKAAEAKAKEAEAKEKAAAESGREEKPARQKPGAPAGRDKDKQKAKPKTKGRKQSTAARKSSKTQKQGPAEKPAEPVKAVAAAEQAAVEDSTTAEPHPAEPAPAAPEAKDAAADTKVEAAEAQDRTETPQTEAST